MIDTITINNNTVNIPVEYSMDDAESQFGLSRGLMEMCSLGDTVVFNCRMALCGGLIGPNGFFD